MLTASFTDGKVFVIRKNQNYLKLICTLSSTSLSFQATITFKHDSFTYEPYITGLSLSKTLQKNKIDKRVTNINYEYSPSDILRLKCDTDYVTYKLEWHFTREDMVAHQIDHVVSSDGALHMNQIEGVFQLAPHVKSTLISCILLKDKEEYITNLYVIRTESMRGEARLNETDHPIPEGGYRYNGSVNYFYMQSNVETEIANKIEGNTTSTSTNRTTTIHTRRTTAISTRGPTIIPTRRTAAISTRGTTIIPTRRTTAIPTRGTTIIPTNITTEENISDGKHSNSSAKHRNLGTEYDPSGIIVIVIIFVIIFCAFIAIVTIICVRICRARKRKETEQVYENAMVLMDVNEDRASTTSSHIYESISEPEPQDQIRAAHSTATSAAKDISQRPTIPSEEESEDCKPYIHYDTPYEFRIFRMGVPVVKVPDRFRSRRGRF